MPNMALPTSPDQVNHRRVNLKPWWHWLILLACGLFVILVPLPASAARPTQRTFHIDASRFQYAPAILKVNPGDKVTIELVSMDVVHGLAMDGYDLQTTADPGQTSRITFVADREGVFRFYCTVTCGNMHPFMTGKLEVGQNLLLWRAGLLSGLILWAVIWMRRR